MDYLKSVKESIVSLVKFTRFFYWAPTVQQNLTVSILMVLLSTMNFNSIVALALFTVMQFFMLSYTFIINDVGDKEIDIKAGKIKLIHKLSTTKIALLLLILAFGSLIVPLIYGTYLVFAVSVLAFVLLTFYSIKPLRFKERGLLGIFVADFAQRSLLFLIFGLLISADPLLILFFMGWLFIIGFQDELNHQMMDNDADKKSGTKTWIQHVGYTFGKRVLIACLLVSFIYLLLPFLFLGFIHAIVVSLSLLVFRAITMQYIYDKLFFSHS